MVLESYWGVKFFATHDNKHQFCNSTTGESVQFAEERTIVEPIHSLLPFPPIMVLFAINFIGKTFNSLTHITRAVEVVALGKYWFL